MGEKYQLIMIIFSSFNTYFGLLGIAFQYKNIPLNKMRAVFLGLCFCIALHLTTQLESRFTLSLCLLLMPFAFYQFWDFVRKRNIQYLLLFTPFFLFVNLFWHLLLALSPGYEAVVKSGAIM